MGLIFKKDLQRDSAKIPSKNRLKECHGLKFGSRRLIRGHISYRLILLCVPRSCSLCREVSRLSHLVQKYDGMGYIVTSIARRTRYNSVTYSSRHNFLTRNLPMS